MTTSHLTNPAKDAGQVIGYSYLTMLPAEELLAGHPKDDSRVIGYALANTALPKTSKYSCVNHTFRFFSLARLVLAAPAAFFNKLPGIKFSCRSI
jgi:hypothetical protein